MSRVDVLVLGGAMANTFLAAQNLPIGASLHEPEMLDAARKAGYASVLLDTLDDMESARALYEELGFEEIPPYYHNPIAGAHYLKADL